MAEKALSVCVVGLGLMGGSLALALRVATKCHRPVIVAQAMVLMPTCAFNQKITGHRGVFLEQESTEKTEESPGLPVPSVASCSNLAVLIATGPNAEQILANNK